MSFYNEGRAKGDSDAGVQRGSSSLSRARVSCSGWSRIPANVAAGTRLPHQRSRTRLPASFFLWSSIPDDELLDAGAQAGSGIRRARRAGEADARATASQALVENFAGQWLYLRNLQASTPDRGLFPDFDDSLRQRCSGRRSCSSTASARGPQRARAADAPTTRSSTSGWRGTTASRTSTAATSGASRSTDDARARAARPGQHPDRDVAPGPDVAGVRGKWILENLLGTPPPPPPPNVPRAEEDRRTRQRLLDARADGAASRESGVRELPRDDGSAWLRRSRTSTGSEALDARRDRRRRSTRRACCPTARRSTASAGLREALLTKSGSVRDDVDREAADLRARPRARVLRCAGRARHRARRGHQRLSFLVPDPGHRQERAVSNEQEGRARSR